MRRRARTDANQKEIIEQLRSIAGISVFPTHQLGSGFPDIAVGYRGRNFFFEIKNPDLYPSERRLTEDEVKFFERWQGQVDEVLYVEDILEVLGLTVMDNDSN